VEFGEKSSCNNWLFWAGGGGAAVLKNCALEYCLRVPSSLRVPTESSLGLDIGTAIVVSEASFRAAFSLEPFFPIPVGVSGRAGAGQPAFVLAVAR